MPVLNANCKVPKAKRLSKGFSLIELLIVISLFGFVSSLITVGYYGFSKRQLLTNAVGGLKSNMRFVQNQATSGVKDPKSCNSTNSILKGWYVEVNLVQAGAGIINNTYNIKSLCVNILDNQASPCSAMLQTGNYECSALYKTVTLPDNVQFVPAGAFAQSKYVLFEPLKSEPTFFTNAAPVTLFYTAASLNADPRNASFLGTLTQVPSGITFGLFELSNTGTVSNVTVSATGGIQ